MMRPYSGPPSAADATPAPPVRPQAPTTPRKSGGKGEKVPESTPEFARNTTPQLVQFGTVGRTSTLRQGQSRRRMEPLTL